MITVEALSAAFAGDRAFRVLEGWYDGNDIQDPIPTCDGISYFRAKPNRRTKGGWKIAVGSSSYAFRELEVTSCSGRTAVRIRKGREWILCLLQDYYIIQFAPGPSWPVRMMDIWAVRDGGERVLMALPYGNWGEAGLVLEAILSERPSWSSAEHIAVEPAYCDDYVFRGQRLEYSADEVDGVRSWTYAMTDRWNRGRLYVPQEAQRCWMT